MNNVMIDIETLGTNPNAVILSLAAVEFCPNSGKTAREFYKKIDLNSALKLGLEIDTETLIWWQTQNPVAFKEMFIEAEPVEKVLEQFSNWFDVNYKVIWANSPSFDLVILKNAFRKLNLPTPWKYNNERCVRTMAALNPDAKKNTDNPEAHNALSDCYFQINYLTKIFNSF